MQTQIPVIVTFISGILIMALFFIPREPFTQIEQLTSRWYIIISGFALLLGIDSLILYHWRKIKRRDKDAVYSLILIISFFIALFWGIWAWYAYGGPFISNSSYLWLFQNIYLPLDATMFSILGFFIASASYRAFRARNLESSLLLISAAIVMMGRVPFGGSIFIPFFFVFMIVAGSYFLYIATKYTGFNAIFRYFLAILFLSLGIGVFFYSELLSQFIPSLSNWIMQYPNTAGQRAIILGLTLGSIAFSLRIIFGIERGYIR
ncbi:MAG: hypothetical protein N2504_05770 [candidate division WOR-3 bacterium]|nr:hypothetical protein [candidate division WOR-3 bacterium]MCX7948078.1 hypothetical protein [candidate division WOR-3 bacterium]MDW8150984.1 hypothetical protein [candidate division WOR-3 bacterium]